MELDDVDDDDGLDEDEDDWLLLRLLLEELDELSSSVRTAAGINVVPELGSSFSRSAIPKKRLNHSWMVPARLFVTVSVQLSPTAATFRPPNALSHGPPS